MACFLILDFNLPHLFSFFLVLDEYQCMNSFAECETSWNISLRGIFVTRFLTVQFLAFFLYYLVKYVPYQCCVFCQTLTEAGVLSDVHGTTWFAVSFLLSVQVLLCGCIDQCSLPFALALSKGNHPPLI